MLLKSNATFRLKNSEKKFDFRYYKMAGKVTSIINQVSVSTVENISIRGSRVVSVLGHFCISHPI